MDETTTTTETRKRTGRVTIGEIAADAKWRLNGDLVKITVATEALPPASVVKLNEYRGSTKPLPVTFPVEVPGFGQKLTAVVIGYERGQGEVTLYVKNARG